MVWFGMVWYGMVWYGHRNTTIVADGSMVHRTKVITCPHLGQITDRSLTDNRFPLQHLDVPRQLYCAILCGPLYSSSCRAGHLHDLPHVSWVGRSCTTPHNGKRGTRWSRSWSIWCIWSVRGVKCLGVIKVAAHAIYTLSDGKHVRVLSSHCHFYPSISTLSVRPDYSKWCGHTLRDRENQK